MTNKLDTTAFKDALGQLKKALEFSKSDLAHSSEDLFEQFRNSTVQCYEFCFELSWKFIKRQITIEHPSPDLVDKWDYKELIREAAVRGLVKNPENWFEFRRLRNLSSHTYDTAKAKLVYSRAEALLQDASHVLAQIEARI